MVPRSQKRKENSGRGCGRPRVTELVGGRAELIIPITPVVLGTKGARRRERVLVRQPQNRPGPPPTPGPTLSPGPLVTLSLASFPASLSVYTPHPPPFLSPLGGGWGGVPKVWGP